tara:strand:+ start:298 stop:546 length:249 start_codon:yes stop_codon:yes gene_type:complete
MASIKHHGSTLQAHVRRTDQPSISKCVKSLTEATAWARQMGSAIDMGTSPRLTTRNSSVPTLGEALSGYQDEVLPLKKGAAK